MSERTSMLKPPSGFSRRDFLRGSGAAAAATAMHQTAAAVAQEVKVGVAVVSGTTALELDVNGKKHEVKVEPRTTLLEALRYQLDLTGAKPICNDGSSGGATVLVDGKPMQANMMLAMQAAGKKIQTVESLAGDAGCQCVRRGRRPAVRLLHAGLRRGREGVSDQEPQGDRRGDPQGTQRQPLPLRNLCQHHPGLHHGGEGRNQWLRLFLARERQGHDHRQARQAPRWPREIDRQGQVHVRHQPEEHARGQGARLPARALQDQVDRRGPRARRSPASSTPKPCKQSGNEIEWQGELLAVVAAENEGAAREGIAAIKVDYEMLDVFVTDEDLKAAEAAGRTSKGGGKTQTVKEPGDNDNEEEFVAKEIDRLLKESAFTVEGYYGIDAITHCCLEPHGSTVMWEGDKLIAYLSTQNVSGTDEGFANDLKIAATDVEVKCDYIGGGFGSKFAPDYWGMAAARISKATGRPVKFMLDRDQEQKIAGNRPSGYIKVRLGADKDGVMTVWDSEHWGTTGVTPGGVSQATIPYVFAPKNYRRNAINIKTNNGQSRAWRAPNHPQACAMSQTALDDLAGEDAGRQPRHLHEEPGDRRRGARRRRQALGL